MSNKLVEINNLYKIYKSGSLENRVETVAIKGITLDIMDDDFIAVMGPSGSGKSTLLNILGGLELPSAGDVKFQAKNRKYNLSNMTLSQLDDFRYDKIGVIFQMENLIPHLTALENVELPLQFLGESDSRSRAIELLEKLGMSHRLEHRTSMLSAGEKQRVALASALAFKPLIILADEPTGELDSENLEQVMGLFKEIHEKEGVIFFIVTHNANVAKYAKRFFSLYDGQLVEQSNIDSFELVHSDDGEFLIPVDKMSRVTIPQDLLSEIQINDGLISYQYDESSIRITSYNEDEGNTASIDQNNRILFPKEIKNMMTKGAYRGKFDEEANHIIIYLKEVNEDE